MQTGMLVIWIGALLILVGVASIAVSILWRGRLSDARRMGAGGADVTLEPQGRVRAFNPRHHWPSLALITVGIILILAEAAI